MNKFKPVNDVKNSRGESLFDSPGSFFRMYPTVSATKTEKSNDIEYWYLPRALHMTILNNFKIHVTIPGDIEMKAGDVVDVEFPMFEPGKDGGRAKNKRFSGKYLVAGLNYKFISTGSGQKANFECIAELVTDSFNEQTPAATSGANKIGKGGK